MQILNAAIDCFCRSGFRGASISDICAAAGISPGLLYHYFDSKETIIKAMTEVELHRAGQAILEFDGEAKGIGFIENLLDKLDYYEKHNSTRKIALEIEMMAEGTRNPVVGQVVQNFDKEKQDMIETLLRRGQKVGQIDKNHRPEFLASVLSAVIEGLSIRSVKNPSFSVEDRMRALTLIIEQVFVLHYPAIMKPPKRAVTRTRANRD